MQNISDLQSSQITTTLCDMFVLLEQLSVNVEHLVAEVMTWQLKGPFKYLVAKLHGCYPGANSLWSAKIVLRAFFGASPSPIQVAV